MKNEGVCRFFEHRCARTVVALLVLIVVCAAGGPLQAADGLIDFSFNTTGSYEIWDYYYNAFHDTYAQDVVADGSGDLFLVGYVTSLNGDFDWAIGRIDAQGSVDQFALPFDQGGNNNDEANAAVLDAAGRLVVAGTTQASNSRGIRVCRFLPDTLNFDHTFGSDGCAALPAGTGVYFNVRRIARSGDGGFIVGGSIIDNGTNSDFFAVKLTSSGAFDASFGVFGIQIVAWDFETKGIDYVNDMAVDSNGSILLAGTAQHPTWGNVFAVAKLTSAGDLDTSFAGGAGKLAIFTSKPYFATAIAVVPGSGTDFVAATFIDNGDGTSTDEIGMFSGAGAQISFPFSAYHLLNVTWDPSSRNSVRRLIYQSDGKLLIVGDSRGGIHGSTYEVSRLAAAEGLLDPTYGVAGDSEYTPYTWGEGDGEDVASATLSAGRLVVFGDTGDLYRNWLVVRLTNALIFTDGFESDGTGMWSPF